jgi:ribosomal-protein-alanine N-acetyltransferase
LDEPEFPDTFPILETERLILREITHEDTKAIFRNFSDPEVAKWFFEQPLTNIEQAAKFIDQFNDEFDSGEGLTWALELKFIGTCVGTCGYGGIELGSVGEIGFDLAKEYWGKGLMSEALVPVIEYGFEKLKFEMIEAHSYPTNTRAIHLLKKVGFQLERVSEDSHYFSRSKSKVNNLSQR